MAKGETLNFCDVTSKFYSNDIIFSYWSIIQYGIIKSNSILKNAGNLEGFTLQIRHLVDTVIILINTEGVNLNFGLQRWGWGRGC